MVRRQLSPTQLQRALDRHWTRVVNSKHRKFKEKGAKGEFTLAALQRDRKRKIVLVGTGHGPQIKERNTSKVLIRSQYNRARPRHRLAGQSDPDTIGCAIEEAEFASYGCEEMIDNISWREVQTGRYQHGLHTWRDITNDELVDLGNEIRDEVCRVNGITGATVKFNLFLDKEVYTDTRGALVIQELPQAIIDVFTESRANPRKIKCDLFGLSKSYGSFGSFNNFRRAVTKAVVGAEAFAEETVVAAHAPDHYDNSKLKISLDTGLLRCILTGEVTGSILEEIIHQLEATDDTMDMSINALGRNGIPLHPEITIYDYALSKVEGHLGVSAYHVDAEGVAPRKTYFIKNGGIYQPYLAGLVDVARAREDSAIAKIYYEKDGDGVTGNMRIGNMKVEKETVEEDPDTPRYMMDPRVPVARASTVVMEPGSSSREELINQISGGRGIELSYGLHGESLPGTLQCSMTVAVAKVYDDNGDVHYMRPQEPGVVIQATGSAQRILRSISLVGDRKTLLTEYSMCEADSGKVTRSAYCPAILCNELDVVVTKPTQHKNPESKIECDLRTKK